MLKLFKKKIKLIKFYKNIHAINCLLQNIIKIKSSSKTFIYPKKILLSLFYSII